MAPSHKKGRGGDRLSALPDNALERVLSHLPSGEAVRSSALSRRWRRVHEGVPVIDLVDPKTGDRCGISNQKVCFDHTVTSAIISKGAETPIRTFRLNAFHPPYGLFDQWIAIVATSGVEDLDVKLRYNESSRHTLCPYGLSRAASADFPKSDRNRYKRTHHHIFRCPTLRRLQLTNWTLDLPATVDMALLDTLCLARIMDPNGEMQQLISGCPSLAHLTLEECPSIQDIAITSPRLRTFTMICCHNAGSIELHSTYLQSLHYKGGLPPRHSSFFAVNNHAGIKALRIDVCENLSSKAPEDIALVTRLISQCKKLTYLHLSLRPSMAYYSSSFTSVLRGLDSLTHLSLQGCLHTDHAIRSVAALLVNTKYLEELSLFPLGPEPPKEKKRTWEMNDEDTESDSDTEPQDCTVPEGVEYTSRMPESLWRTYVGCLEYNLKRIYIANFHGRPLEKMLARFLLSRAAALEEFSVTLAAGLYPRKKETTKELISWRWNRHTRVDCY
ncbi:hypothetical protein QYE76_047134 [Lolium multiflorum]|uniref:F-box domain-containing protein n=1 Tax=Lolium multiflorum TaxID=4521 RepID=A0AAD8TPN3_LOLMU|nr:hypothetical protein QYE76_047134 [Lolium multiflorum]